MKKRSFMQKMKYQFDNIMSKGTIALIGLLCLVTFVIVCIAGAITVLIGMEGGIVSSVWVSFMHALDPGTITTDTLDNIPYVILQTIVTICGIFISSVLIGIISSGLERKLSSLRKGTSIVIEDGHTIILGFNDNIYTLINELIGANENQKDGCIVVVGQEEKEVMEDAIAARFPDTKTTRIICRSGSPCEPHILERCSAETSKSIIINEYDDPQSIKIILALTSYLKEKELTHPNLYFTVAINDEQNVEAARIAGEGRAEVIFANDAISRIIAHTCRQPGLSQVLVELFDYDGDELYFEDVPELRGLTFKDTLNRFDKAVVFGIRNDSGTYLNPPMDTIITADDKLILLEDDDGSFVVSENAPKINESLMVKTVPERKLIETDDLLVLGSNPMLPAILKEYDCYVDEGTRVVIVSDEELDLSAEDYRYINPEIRKEGFVSRKRMEEILTEDLDNVLILSNIHLDAEEADARTLLSLIYLWDIIKKTGHRVSITSEMQKTVNQRLATGSRGDDFVIGSNIVNLLMTQIAENRELTALFEDILDEEGSELYMKPVENYVVLNTPVDFYTVTESAARQGHIAIGYKKMIDDDMLIVTNPLKSEEVIFAEGDLLIVVAED
ncbi:MAG: hypothetical protein IJ397_02700 [Lachnospiraceae bacterium]|nr:hypothetical protein [Lachnospiraceae bacterium]